MAEINRFGVLVRVIMLYLKRVVNRFFSMYNHLKFDVYGVSHGKNCRIDGKFYIKLSPTSSCSVGDDFYYSSGRCINALCANKMGAFYATDNAVIKIGNKVGMSSTILWAHKSITIGDNVKIGGNCILIDTDAHSLDFIKRRDYTTDIGASAPIVIEDDVLVGANSIILKGVKIGARSIVGAGSVVTRNIPPDSVVCGNPARVVRSNECSSYENQ